MLVAAREAERTSLSKLHEKFCCWKTAVDVDSLSSDWCWVHEFNQCRYSVGEYLRLSTVIFDRLLEKLKDSLKKINQFPETNIS